MLRWVSSLILAWVIPNGAFSCTIPSEWARLTTEHETDLEAALFIQNQPVPVSQPFETHIRICADRVPETVSVTAIMPAHQHGMNYRPTVSVTEDGTYLVSGMVFHMPGDWRVDVAVQMANGTTHFSSPVVAR